MQNLISKYTQNICCVQDVWDYEEVDVKFFWTEYYFIRFHTYHISFIFFHKFQVNLIPQELITYDDRDSQKIAGTVKYFITNNTTH